MTSKQLINHLCYEYNTKNYNEERLKAAQEIKKELEILDILKKKGVAVGFIQLQIKENCGGVREYNDYIGKDKSLHLTADEYKKLKEWIENE